MVENGYLWIENDIFDQKSLNLKKVILEKKLYSTMLCGLLFGFDTILTEIKNAKGSLAP